MKEKAGGRKRGRTAKVLDMGGEKDWHTYGSGHYQKRKTKRARWKISTGLFLRGEKWAVKRRRFRMEKTAKKRKMGKGVFSGEGKDSVVLALSVLRRLQ